VTAAVARTVVCVDFSRRRQQDPPTTAAVRVPRVVKTLALAHRMDAMIAAGEVKDYAQAARILNLTRSRVSQITSLLLLAPAVQEAILDLPMTTGRDPVTERQLRPIVAEPDWNVQLQMWRNHGLATLLPHRDGTRILRQDDPGPRPAD